MLNCDSMQTLATLPSIVADENAFRLIDLIESDFQMNITDPDFNITQEQLIKVVKILLYKHNLSAKKNSYERGELASMVNERIEKYESLLKSNLTEVNSFLHTVHEDFENFLTKHKKEHTSLNMRLLKVTEDLNMVLNQIQPVKNAVDSYATMLACLVEFNSIEHALTIQDEDDREDMQLLGKGKKLKIPEVKGNSSARFKTISNPVESQLSNISINKELNTKGLSLSVRNSAYKPRNKSSLKSSGD